MQRVSTEPQFFERIRLCGEIGKEPLLFDQSRGVSRFALSARPIAHCQEISKPFFIIGSPQCFHFHCSMSVCMVFSALKGLRHRSGLRLSATDRK